MRPVAMVLSRLLVYLFFWIWIPDRCYSQMEQFAGPFQVVLKQIDHCDESGTDQIRATSTRINKVSRTKYVYTTNITVETTLDDNVTAELDISNFGNGGWRPHFMQMEFPKFCSSMKAMMPVLSDAIFKAIKSDCPVKPGYYEMHELDMENIKVTSSVPNFPYGQYRADIFGRRNGTLIGCIRAFADVVPAKRRRPPKKPNNIH